MDRPVLGVAVFLRVEDAVLLVRRSRPPHQDAWAFPGGKVQPGEFLTEAASRELLEETGLKANNLVPIDFVEIIDRGPAGTLLHHYLVVVLSGMASGREAPIKGDDASEARWIRVSDAADLVLTPETARILRGVAASAT